MSAVKRYADDVLSARRAAFTAAGLPTACERMGALRAAFQAVGEAAGSYADPAAVVRQLVHETARTYSSVRKALREGVRA